MSFVSIKKVSPEESSKIRLILFATLLFGIATAIFYPLDLLSHLFPGLFREDSSCVLLNVTGLPCPFCGMSRALGAISRFDLMQALYYNPSSVVFFTFTALFGMGIFVLSIYNRKVEFNFTKKTLLIMGLMFLVMWALNIFFGHHDH